MAEGSSSELSHTGYLISHNVSLTSDPHQHDIYCVPGETKFILETDPDHTDPFKDDTTLLVCVTCLFPPAESDQSIINRVDIGLALDKEFVPKVQTVFVSLITPLRKTYPGPDKNIQLNIGLPHDSKITSKEVIDYLIKYFGPSYNIIPNDTNGILTSTSPVTLNVFSGPAGNGYTVPTATKFRFYPPNDGNSYQLGCEHAVLNYNKIENVYVVPVFSSHGSEDSPKIFTLKAETRDTIGGTLSVLLTYYFTDLHNVLPFSKTNISSILRSLLNTNDYSFTEINVYNVVVNSNDDHVITANIMTSAYILPEQYASLCRTICAAISSYGHTFTVFPLSGPGLL